MSIQPERTEQIGFGQLQARLAQLAAEPFPERSSSTMHVYFSRNLGYWVGVSKRGGLAELAFFRQCPCGG